tara:strand:+ start:2707 stop:4059 length:1353 start_codon:yes stop_codon:yes gene_type:complete
MPKSNPTKLLLLNTIGLTNVEVILAKLAKYKEVLALPGQNFGVFDHNLYRPHDYSNWDSIDIFNSLSRNLYTKNGRIWMGLTKHMNQRQKDSYSKDKHSKIFIEKLGPKQDFINIIKCYIVSFYNSYGIDTNDSKYATWFSNNVLLCHKHYPRFEKEVKVIHVSSEISRWLTVISHTRTWNCVDATKFWILNNLYANNYLNKNPGNIAIYSNEVIDNPEISMKKIEDFLSINSSDLRDDYHGNGFIDINNDLLNKQKQISYKIIDIYKGNKWYQLANTFEEWNSEFLEKNETQNLLKDFSEFWNTTSHTNFDWIGPIGDQLMDHLINFIKVKEINNLSFDFYHKYFVLDSDNYDSVQSNLQHSLGCLEDKIEIPPMPYFIRICMAYIISCAKNSIKHGHSYISPRNGSIYKRLNNAEFKDKIKIFGLIDKSREMEDAINEADMLFSNIKN